MSARTITISASYGAGGSVVAPAVAGRLGVPFLGRALPGAGQLARDAESATEEERTESLLARMLASFAAGPDALAGGAGPVPGIPHDDALRQGAEARVGAFVHAGGGVILGWGATVIAAAALHVHLDGPAEARARQAAAIASIEPEVARQHLSDTDHVRGLYMRRLYGKDWRDPALYHLAIDSTAVSLDACTELVVAAAAGFRG